MKTIFFSVCLIFCLSALRAEELTFNRDIRPILSEKCFFCHGFDAKKREGDLRLDVREDAVAAKAVVPGKPQESALIARVFSDDADDLMPPPKSHKTLSPAEKATLRRWIEQGAPYQKHWAFEPPARSAEPAVKTRGWVRNPIDAFILAGLEKAGLQPAEEADRRTLARRLWLDLTGLPPKPEEVEAFVNDSSPSAHESLVMRLMDRKQWGEHRGRYWLDAARYGDTHGIHHDAYREIWPYRDWVIEAFNRNQPFDRFTVEQIAGDLLPDPTRDQLVATGFHRCNITTSEGGAIGDEYLAIYAADRVTTTSWVWLGLTANCAQCHDHKFDPVTTRDFYSMAAFFRNTTQAAMDGNVKDSKPVIYLPAEADAKRFEELPKLIAGANAALAKRRKDGAKVAQLWADSAKTESLAIAAKPVAKPDWAGLKGAFSASSRVKVPASAKDGGIIGGLGWELFVQAKRFGLRVAAEDGKSEKVALAKRDVLQPGKSQHVLATHDGKGGFKLWLDGAETEFDLRENKAPKASTPGQGVEIEDGRVFASVLTKADAKSLSDEASLRQALAAAPEKRSAQQKAALTEFYFRSVDAEAARLAAEADGLTAEETAIRARSTVSHIQEEKKGAQPMANILMRGAYDKVGDPVPAAGFSALHAMPADAPQNRLGLARWLMAPENPLTARVTVNRFWQELFGTGLVRTSEDFGSQGEPPSNQALLDWLAVEFRESGWDVKKLFALMVNSAAYRQSAKTTPDKLARDPQNRLVSRGPRFRMDAEMVRDYALAVSGTLSPKMGGPGTKPYQPSNIWEVVGLHGARYTQDKGENLYRRTVYHFWKRQSPPPNLEVFNAPSRETCVVRRERTNTPLQALVTLNDPQFVEAARRLAEAVMKERKGDEPAIIPSIAERVLLRPLRPGELAVARETAQALEADFAADPKRAEAFLKIGETKPDPALPPVKLATFGMIASQLLNLDEALNK